MCLAPSIEKPARGKGLKHKHNNCLNIPVRWEWQRFDEKQLDSAPMAALLDAIQWNPRLKEIADTIPDPVYYQTTPPKPEVFEEEWGDCITACSYSRCERPGTMKNKTGQSICKKHFYDRILNENKSLRRNRNVKR